LGGEIDECPGGGLLFAENGSGRRQKTDRFNAALRKSQTRPAGFYPTRVRQGRVVCENASKTPAYREVKGMKMDKSSGLSSPAGQFSDNNRQIVEKTNDLGLFAIS
jgi:hypothetical protein